MNNIFVLFSKNEKINDNNITKLNKETIRIKLNKQRVERIFCTSLKNNFIEDDYYVHLYEFCVKDTTSNVEMGIYYNDSCLDIKQIINDNDIIGVSSVSQNRIIYYLLFGNEDYNNIKEISNLKGENGWSNLSEYFKTLKETGIEYVSLRKNEFLPDKFVENDKDIDVLCSNKERFVLISNAQKRSMGISGYQIKVNDEWIALDVRFQGDYYFDSSWENTILKQRVLNNKGIYVLDKENQIFTVLYHVLTQKKSVSDYYKNLIFSSFGIKESDYLNYLIPFMKKEGYYFYRPIDKSVVQNNKNISKIKKILKPINFKRRIIHFMFSKIPYRLIPKKILNYLIND